jgi:hypothetical protein
VYEVGLAHGYGKPVIPITQDISTLSFDLSRETAIAYLLEDLGAMESKMQGFICKIVSNPRPVISDGRSCFAIRTSRVGLQVASDPRQT